MEDPRTTSRKRDASKETVRYPDSRGRSADHVRTALRCLGIILGALLASSTMAADLVWDCDTASGYQTCSGTFDEKKFTRDGKLLETWPAETATLTLPPAKDSSTSITVTGTRSVDTILVRGSGYALKGAGTLTLVTSPTVFRTDSSLVLSALLGGSNPLEKSGKGSLLLSTSQPAWRGRMRVATGTLILGSDSALGDTTQGTIISSGGVLDINGHTLRMEDVELAGGSLINAGGGQKNGAERLRVTSNSTFGGTTSWDIRSGSRTNPLFSVAAGITLTKIGGSGVSIAGVPLQLDGTIAVREGRVIRNYGTTHSGSGSLTLDSAAGFTVTNDQSRVVIPYPITMRGAYLEAFNNEGVTEFSGNITLTGALRNTFNNISTMVVSGLLSGSGRLSKWSDGLLVLTQDESFSGTLGVEGGTLQVGDGGATGSLKVDTLWDNARVEFNHSGSKTFGGILRGRGRLTKNGTGTDIFTSDVTPDSGINILQGTMQIGAGGTTGNVSGTILNSGTLVIDRANEIRFGDSLQGTGTLVKRGGGRLTLSGSTALRGGVRIEAGEVRLDGVADSTSFVVSSGGTLRGRGRAGLVVVSNGTLGAGTIDSIGVLDATALDLSSGISTTILVRAIGSTKPGIQYDRIRVAGNSVLDGESKLLLDLTGFSKAGTLSGIIQAGSVSGKFRTIEVIGGARWIVSVTYSSSAVNIAIAPVPWSEKIDTILAPGIDSTTIPLRPGLEIVAPPRVASRTIVVTFLDSTLGRGISGADSVLVLGSGVSLGGPLLLRMPLGLIPRPDRISGERPSVLRIDSANRLVRVPVRAWGDSIADFVADHDGAYWIGYDTSAPRIEAVYDRDSIGSGARATVSWRLRDNVADAQGSLCLRKAGETSDSCALLAIGDSADGFATLSSLDIPFGGAVVFEARDSRSTTRGLSKDLVVELDTLRAPDARLEDRYELVSLPYSQTGSDAFPRFTEQWGSPDPHQWRVFSYDSTGFSEFTGADSSASPTRAYWVRTRGVERKPWIHDAWTWPVSLPVDVHLEPGWNMVANPFGFDLDWNAVRAVSGLDSLPIAGPYLFEGATETWLEPDSVERIPPWRGMAIHNASGSRQSIKLPSIPTSKAAPRALQQETLPLDVALTLAQADRLGTTLRIGITTASSALASRRIPLPPSPASGLVAWLDAPDRGLRLMRSLQTPSDSDLAWTMRLDGLTPGQPLTLRTLRTGLDSTIPVHILDKKSGRWQPLAPTMEFTVGSETSRTFGFLAGPSLHRELSRNLELSLRGRTLRWSLPASLGPQHVRIELRDLSGRLLATPLDETLDPGTYQKFLSPPSSSRPTLLLLRLDHQTRTILLPTLH